MPSRMRLRVLAVVIRFEGGGAERSVERLAAAAVGANLELTRVALDPPRPGESQAHGAVLNPTGRRGGIRVLTAAHRLRRILTDDGPDVIHLHCEAPELV